MTTLWKIGSAVCAAALAGCAHNVGAPALPAAGAPALRAVPNAGGFAVLYAFHSIPDGMTPAGGLVAIGGTFYGTTQVGGQGDSGAIYSVTTGGKEHVIHSFGSGGPDGVFPMTGMTVLGGALYGTAFSGGNRGFGAIFKSDTSGNEHLIYSFGGGKDGANPSGALVAVNGKLYGTTFVGGGSANCAQGCGTVFEVTTGGKERLLHSFKGGSDGIGPLGNLVAIGTSLYGTVSNGGHNGVGAVFKATTGGTYRVVYAFKNDSHDGTGPEAGLTNAGGKLYGTTNAGGEHGDGCIFTTTTAGAERVLYSFKGGSDGANPEANLISVGGTLYGTTATGGGSNAGTVFASSTAGHERVLHAFKSSDGSDPRAPLAVLGGTLYGTASLNGANGVGTVFKIKP